MMLEVRHVFENPLTIELSGGDSLTHQIAKLDKTIMKLHEAITLLEQTGDQLTKASGEITAKINELKSSDPDLSDAGNAAVQRIAAIAQALDDVVPDEVPTDPNAPAPAITEIPS